MSKAFAKVEIENATFQRADALLARLPLEMRIGVIEKALRAAAKPVETRARQIAPDSQRSGSRARWSKKTRAKQANSKPHRQTIGHSTIRGYQGLRAIYVGPLHPAGNLINIIGHNRQQVLWGRRTNRTLPPNEFMKQAAQETTAAQQSAFVETVQRETDEFLQAQT